jgi:hypothetical protein
MTTLSNHAPQKTKQRWITLTEWPMSLLQAYDAGILGGEAAETAKAIHVMQQWRTS